MMAEAGNRSTSHGGRDDEIEEAFLRDPEARKLAQELAQKQVEAWVHPKIPAMRGRTPMQAVRDPDGREMVEALLLGWERRIKDFPSIVVPDLNAIRRLLNLKASDSSSEQ